MTKTEDNRANRRARHAAIRAQVAAEEAENATTLDVPLHLRIDQQLDAQLREWAATEHIPTSALVRRLLRQAMQEHHGGSPTTAQVEEIARRVAREELHHS